MGQAVLCQGHCLVKDTAVSHGELGVSGLKMKFGEDRNVFSGEGIPELGGGWQSQKNKTKPPRLSIVRVRS